jgi:O-acetyl-ADP-ribose deacetylase (regulator of RNase III)
MIRVELGSLVDAKTEAVLRPVRADLAPVSAASREIGLAAGTTLDERLQRLDTLPMGGAVVTPSGDLTASFIIHIVVMSDEEPQTDATIRRALRNGLDRAADLGIESLALPPLGMGAGVTEPEVSAENVVAVLQEHLEKARLPEEIVITVTTAYQVEIFQPLIS